MKTQLSDRYLDAQDRAHKVLGETRRGAVYGELLALRRACRKILAIVSRDELDYELRQDVEDLVTEPPPPVEP